VQQVCCGRQQTRSSNLGEVSITVAASAIPGLASQRIRRSGKASPRATALAGFVPK